jgi:hypothetical protein
MPVILKNCFATNPLQIYPCFVKLTYLVRHRRLMKCKTYQCAWLVGKMRKTWKAYRLVVGITLTSVPHCVRLRGREVDITASGCCAMTGLGIIRFSIQIMLSESHLISNDGLTK